MHANPSCRSRLAVVEIPAVREMQALSLPPARSRPPARSLLSARSASILLLSPHQQQQSTGSVQRQVSQTAHASNAGPRMSDAGAVLQQQQSACWIMMAFHPRPNANPAPAATQLPCRLALGSNTRSSSEGAAHSLWQRQQLYGAWLAGRLPAAEPAADGCRQRDRCDVSARGSSTPQAQTWSSVADLASAVVEIHH